MSEFVPALDAEIAALEAEIAADPRATKLRELKRVRALYPTKPATAPATIAAASAAVVANAIFDVPKGVSQTRSEPFRVFEVPTVNTVNKSMNGVANVAGANTPVGVANRVITSFDFEIPATGSTTGRKPSPERIRATTIARHLLSTKTTPVKTSDIYGYLQRHGVEIGGTVPINNLSAMLSNTPGFRSHGRAGWTLESTEAEP